MHGHAQDEEEELIVLLLDHGRVVGVAHILELSAVLLHGAVVRLAVPVHAKHEGSSGNPYGGDAFARDVRVEHMAQGSRAGVGVCLARTRSQTAAWRVVRFTPFPLPPPPTPSVFAIAAAESHPAASTRAGPRALHQDLAHDVYALEGEALKTPTHAHRTHTQTLGA